MEFTFSGYHKKIKKDFQRFHTEKLFFFGAWCCQYLYNLYSGHLCRIAPAAMGPVTDALAFLWRCADTPYEIDEKQVSATIEKIQDIDIDQELDMTDTNDNGVSKLLGALENTLGFIEAQDSDLIVCVAFAPLDMVDCILTNEYELNTSDPDKYIDHPLNREEFNAQLKLIAYLEGHNIMTSKDKNIFR